MILADSMVQILTFLVDNKLVLNVLSARCKAKREISLVLTSSEVREHSLQRVECILPVLERRCDVANEKSKRRASKSILKNTGQLGVAIWYPTLKYIRK